MISVTLMVIFVALSVAAPGGADGGSYGMMGGGSGWGWTAILLGVPAFLLIVILVLVLAGTREPLPYVSDRSPMSAIEILNSRYARSEISREEFLRVRDDLTEAPRGPT